MPGLAVNRPASDRTPADNDFYRKITHYSINRLSGCKGGYSDPLPTIDR